MALPTVASLCRSLGEDLHAADGFVAPDTPVTAVHISELVDPTLYVSGGELLLTTGLILPTSRIGWKRYVSRLKSIGIAALGIGLGPRYSEPPGALSEACEAAGLTLLIVPASTPFLTISKFYWTARARSWTAKRIPSSSGRPIRISRPYGAGRQSSLPLPNARTT